MPWLPAGKAAEALGLSRGQLKRRKANGAIETKPNPHHKQGLLYWVPDNDEGPSSTSGPSLQQVGEAWVDEGDYTFDAATGTYKTYIQCRKSWLATTKAQHAAILTAYSNFDRSPESLNQIARKIGWGRPVVRDYLKAHQITHDCMPLAAEELDNLSDEDAAEVINERAKRFGRVEVVARRKHQQAVEADADRWRHFEANVLKEISHLQWDVPSIPVTTHKRAAHVNVLSMSDLHIGKRAFRKEGSLKAQRDGYLELAGRAIHAALADGAPALWVVPTGNDLLNSDSPGQRTTAGTEQGAQSIGSIFQAWQSATQLMAAVIEECAKTAPVLVPWIPGNHDKMLSYTVAAALWQRYRDTGQIEVDIAEGDWKAYHRHGCGMVFAHGEKIKTNDMIVKAVVEMSRIAPRLDPSGIVIYTGHFHRERQQIHTDTGIRSVSMGCPSPTDDWHHGRGYLSRRELPVYRQVPGGLDAAIWVPAA